jgi:NADH-quinone oxidoreductase subunit N
MLDNIVWLTPEIFLVSSILLFLVLGLAERSDLPKLAKDAERESRSRFASPFGDTRDAPSVLQGDGLGSPAPEGPIYGQDAEELKDQRIVTQLSGDGSIGKMKKMTFGLIIALLFTLALISSQYFLLSHSLSSLAFDVPHSASRPSVSDSLHSFAPPLAEGVASLLSEPLLGGRPASCHSPAGALISGCAATILVSGGLFGVDLGIIGVKGLLVSCTIVLLLLAQANYQKDRFDHASSGEFPILLSLSTVGLMLLISSKDLISAYLAIELVNLIFYILASFKRSCSFSAEAGLKYMLLGAVSSGLLLFGIAIIYYVSGSTSFHQISLFFRDADLLSRSASVSSNSASLLLGYEKAEMAIASVGVCFILIAVLFKIAAAPFHMWAPDVYEGSPTIVTAYFAIVPKLTIVAFLFILLFGPFLSFFSLSAVSLFSETPLALHSSGTPLSLCDFATPQNISLAPAFGPSFEVTRISTASPTLSGISKIILISGILSIIVGSLGAISQTKLKRLIAFSAIGHVGFILLGLSAGSFFGWFSCWIYLIVYIISSLSVFAFILAIAPRLYVSELAGLFFINPILAISFSFSLLSLAGIPPLAGFFTKYLVLLAVFNSNYGSPMFFFACLAILFSVIGSFYYIRLIRWMFFKDSPLFTFSTLLTITKLASLQLPSNITPAFLPKDSNYPLRGPLCVTATTAASRNCSSVVADHRETTISFVNSLVLGSTFFLLSTLLFFPSLLLNLTFDTLSFSLS